MKRIRALREAVFGLALLTLFATTASRAETNCVPRAVNESKPTLSGAIEDQSKDVALRWRSSAGNHSNGAWWVIDHAICNTGQVPLVIDWPKAGLSNDAYSPLMPGKEMHNEFSAGPTEPQPGLADLSHGGYVASKAPTRIYNVEARTNKTNASLRSSISGTFAGYDGKILLDAAAKAAARADFIYIQFEVTPDSGGYRFFVLPKSADVTNLRLAISSSQNSAFVAALQKVGQKAAGASPLNKLVRNETKNAALERLSAMQFVSMPLIIDKKPTELFIPSELKDIEQATIVLIREDGYPVIFGKVSLFL